MCQTTNSYYWGGVPDRAGLWRARDSSRDRAGAMDKAI